ASAVDGQPTPEGAGRQRMGFGARGPAEPTLDAVQRGAQRLSPPPLGARPRSGWAIAGRLAGRAASAGDAGGPPHQVAGILLLVRGTVGSPARRAIWRAIPPRSAGRARTGRLGPRRSRVR